MATINFTEANDDIINPERGLQWKVDLFWSQQADYDVVRSNGYSLARGSARLDNYRDSTLPQSYLDSLITAFDRARNAKIKLIVRFAYGNDDDDAPKTRILEHISQLAPILNANKDVIALHQLGFIGWWGEWHHSSNGLDNLTDRRDIAFAFLDAVEDRPVQFRIPWWKHEIFGEHLDPANAFNGSRLSRAGHYNDGFLNPSWGYSPDPYGIPTEGLEYWQSVIADEGLYVPIGGEFGNMFPSVNCTNALATLSGEHWDFLNVKVAPAKEVNIQTLIDGGCWEEISEKLGYRFVLKTLSINDVVQPWDKLSINIEIENQGYSAPFNARPVYLVLEEASSGDISKVRLNNDVRYWQPDSPIYVNKEIYLPTEIERGEYRLYLWLPDEILQDVPEYAIRLANEDVWQSATGYNLLCTLYVADIWYARLLEDEEWE